MYPGSQVRRGLGMGAEEGVRVCRQVEEQSSAARS